MALNYKKNQEFKSELVTELEKTCTRKHDGTLQVPSIEYIVQTAEKLGWRREPLMRISNRNEIQNKEKAAE